MVDGPGFRTSIYCAGCRHACPGCHNPQSWDFSGGHPMSTEQIMRIIEADPYANVTFSGGDWCFTGFTYETLLHNPRQRQLLELIDVLVDGPFVKSLRDESLLFRGSSNQRLIDVPASLKTGKTVLFQPDV